MPQPLSERTASFTDSVIRRMTRVSLKYGAVNLSQGFPDFEPPQAILERLAQVAREGPHQYSVTWGDQNFREALARKQSRYMGRGRGHLRQYRGYDVRHDDRGQPRGQGHRLLPLL